MIKKIYKKTICMFLAAAMMLSVAGCGKGKENTSTTEVTTEAEAAVSIEYADTENAEFEQYIRDTFEEDILEDSSTYNQSIKDFSAYGIERPAKGYWMKEVKGNTAEEIIAAEKKDAEEQYQKLMQFEGAALTEEEYFTFITEKSRLELELKRYDYPQYMEVFNPGRGLQANVGTILAEYNFREKQDIEDYITLLETFPDMVDYCVKIENYVADQGHALPDQKADKVIEQCKTFLENKDNHYLIQEFDRKIDEADFLTDEEKAAYKKKDRESIKYLFEGMETIKKTVEANKGKATVKGGLGLYEDGKAYMNEYVVPYFAGSDKTCDEIISDFETRMGQIRSELTMIAQSKPETYQFFMENMGTAFSDFDKNEVPEAIDILMSNTMENYPEISEIKYEASYLSPVLSDIMTNTLAYYAHPAYDDLEHNVIRVNKNHPENKWVNLSHEGCPGHMYQFNYFMSTNPNLLRSKYYSLGYLEGWAVYASYNAYYDYDYPGTDDDKTLGKMFYLNQEYNYLLEERIDLGLNYEGWDEQAMSDYLVKLGVPAESVKQIYDAEMASDPGLLLSYTQGYYEMNGMREYAEKKLGSRFNEVDYHKAILTAGPCMYKDLKFKIDEYIAKNK